MSDERAASTPAALAIVCWRRADGTRVSGCPLPGDRAESLAQAYAKAYPHERYWTEPVPWLVPALRPPSPR